MTTEEHKAKILEKARECFQGQGEQGVDGQCSKLRHLIAEAQADHIPPEVIENWLKAVQWECQC